MQWTLLGPPSANCAAGSHEGMLVHVDVPNVAKQWHSPRRSCPGVWQPPWKLNTPKGWWPWLFLPCSTLGSTRHGRSYATCLGETPGNGLSHHRPADVHLDISLQVHRVDYPPAAPIECLGKRGIGTTIKIQHNWRLVRMLNWSNAIQLVKELINSAIIAPPPLLALRGAALISSLLTIGARLGVVPK